MLCATEKRVCKKDGKLLRVNPKAHLCVQATIIFKDTCTSHKHIQPKTHSSASSNSITYLYTLSRSVATHAKN